MATDPSQPTPNPPQPPGPPPAPGPGASREEWRAWRQQQRDYMRAQLGRGGYNGPWGWFGGGWFWGAVLILLGAYFLLANLGLLGRLRADIFWPIVLILLGLVLLVSRRRWWR